jgi:hypothetical protein
MAHLPLELIDEVCGYEDAYVFRGDLQHIYAFDGSRLALPIEYMCRNPHPAAIWYVLHHLDRVTDTAWLCSSIDDELVSKALCKENIEQLASNSCELATDYCLANMGATAPGGLSKNTNPKAISYLLQHLNQAMSEFYAINDERIATLIIDGALRIHTIFGNTNERVIKYWTHFDIDLLEFMECSENPSKSAVDFLVDSHPDLIWIPGALQNANEKMAKFAMLQIARYSGIIGKIENDIVADWACNHVHMVRIRDILESPFAFVKDSKRVKFIETL